MRDDLRAEQDDLDGLVAGLDDRQWAAATPSPGWRVAEQIAHLAYFDGAAAVAIAHPEAFLRLRSELLAVAVQGPGAMDDLTLAPYRAMAPADLLAAWRADRVRLADASASLADHDRVEWFGPSMGAKSFLTARLMETWAHGQDVVDALGLVRPVTDRLSHLARLGFITRSWSFTVRGRQVADVPIRVVLDAPSGGRWSFGDEDAPESIRGSAEDFCLVVTQRRHVDDTDLAVAGAAARDWMLVAQAFAGGPTEGPPAGTWT